MTVLSERRRLRRLPDPPQPSVEGAPALEVVDVRKHFTKRVGFATARARTLPPVMKPAPAAKSTIMTGT